MAGHQYNSIVVEEYSGAEEEVHLNSVGELKTTDEPGEEYNSGPCWQLENLVGFKVYGMEEMMAATDNFSPPRLIGRGSNGEVFHGVIHGDEIAVKRLIENAWEASEEEQQIFVKEIKSIGSVNHENILPILGFCMEGRSPLLVTRKLCSLDAALYEQGHRQNVLSWDARFRIALGVAKGLEYLHTGARRPMIHCDIKPGNILFDSRTMNAYIADFGLVHLLSHHKSAESGEEIDIGWYYGTVGYRAPEVRSRKRLSTKSDVYSFGKLLYALVSASENVQNLPNSLVRQKPPPKGLRLCCRRFEFHLLYSLVFLRFRSNMLKELVDSEVQEEVNNSGRAIIQASMALRLVVLCTQEKPELRPSMERVRLELESANSCEIPLSVHAAAFMGLQRLRLCSPLVYTVIIGGYNACNRVVQGANSVRRWRGSALAISVYEIVVVIVIFQLIDAIFSAMWREILKLVYWNADDDLQVGLKPDNLLN